MNKIRKKIVRKNTIDKVSTNKSEIFLKNRLAKRWDMWLNSRALTERQASEGTDKDLENNTK